MTPGIRWRTFVLQVGLIGIFGFLSAAAFAASNFATSTVHDQLAAQKITVPAADDKAITSLPQADRNAITPYAGQQVTEGPAAEAYANHFIQVHLSETAGGKTYSEVSTLAQADKTNATLQAQRQTLFMGTMLRGSLLNAYGWWQVGQYAFYVAIGLAAAAVMVLLALAFEVVVWRRNASENVSAPRRAPSPA